MTKKWDIDTEFNEWNDAVEATASKIIEVAESDDRLDDYGQAEAIIGAMVHLILGHHKQDPQTIMEMISEHLQEAELYNNDCQSEDEAETQTEDGTTVNKTKKPLLN